MEIKQYNKITGKKQAWGESLEIKAHHIHRCGWTVSIITARGYTKHDCLLFSCHHSLGTL